MTYMIFAFLGLGCALAFLLPFVFDKTRVANGDTDRAVAGVKCLRQRLDAITESFVALGNDPILAQAASQSADVCLNTYTGETLKYYRGYKEPYLALSFAYNGIARTVQRAESKSISRCWSLLPMPRAASKTPTSWSLSRKSMPPLSAA